MLPGFRILIATVMLSASILVFGLGSAALLRAAHEEFVSQPSWRTAQPPIFPPQFEAQTPTLAMLRIEIPDVRPELPQLLTSPTIDNTNAMTIEERFFAETVGKAPAEFQTAEHIATDTKNQELTSIGALGSQVTAIPIAKIEVIETKIVAEVTRNPIQPLTKNEQARLAARRHQLAILREREVLEAQQKALPLDPFTLFFGGGIQSSQLVQLSPPIMLQ